LSIGENKFLEIRGSGGERSIAGTVLEEELLELEEELVPSAGV
jgi:hypothetical protein